MESLVFLVVLDLICVVGIIRTESDSPQEAICGLGCMCTTIYLLLALLYGFVYVIIHGLTKAIS